MRYAIIEDGKVINIALATQEFADSLGWIDALDASIGDTWDGSNFIKPAPPEPEQPQEVEMTLSEVIGALKEKGLITDDDLAQVKG